MQGFETTGISKFKDKGDNTEMALRTIRTEGDSVLEKICRPVEKIDKRTKDLVGDMLETMYDACGVGLAAPQVGILKRIVVIDTGEEGECVTLVNPVITLKEGEQVGEEGCLSLPGKVAVVKRPDHVICEAFDEDMNPITVEGFGLFARALCHETDHLDGILYPDVAEEPARDITMEEVE